jgi:nucleoside-diphosphate-sugar epimerase
MTSVLVTGGAGFIGSHVVRTLLDAGHETVVLDYFHSYVPRANPTFLRNTEYRFDVLLKGAHLIRGTTTHKDDLRRHVTGVRPEYVLHLAALPLADVAHRNTEEALESIVLGTVNLLEILRDLHSVRKFLFVSSSMVYGDFDRVPMPEHAPKHPKEIYGGMKYAGEVLVEVFCKRYGIPYAIVRPSAVYGPTDNNCRVLQTFVEGAIEGRPLVATAPETTFLDFTYAQDVAQGITKVLLSPIALNEAFNITRGEGRSLAEAIDILREIFPDLRVDARSDDEDFRPARGALDITKARTLVGYDPEFPLEVGLPRYVGFVLQDEGRPRATARSLHLRLPVAGAGT